MTQKIHIGELVQPCVTRTRGEEAAKKLHGLLHAGSVELDLDCMEMISMSFLDGLISVLLAASELGKVTFQTNESSTKLKLRRVAGIRSSPIFCRSTHRTVRKLIPNYHEPVKASFVYSKSSLL